MIPAGGSGKLTAKVHTNPTQTGSLTKAVVVTTDSPGAEKLQLMMTFSVVTPIEIKPKPSLAFNVVQGESKTEGVLLHRQDGKALKVTGIEGGPSFVKFTSTPVDKSDTMAQEGDVWVRGTVDATAAPGRMTDKVRILTDHPDMPSLELSVTAVVRGLFEPIPAQVRLWLPPTGEAGQAANLRVKSNRREKFTITGIEVSHPAVFAVKPQTTDAQDMQVLQVELAPDLKTESLGGPSLQGNIKLTLGDDKHTVVEVPVLVAAKPQARTMKAMDMKQMGPAVPLQPAPAPGAGEPKVEPIKKQ